MDITFFVLRATVILVLLAGLIWSLRLGARQKQKRDVGVSSHVKANPHILNPVLLSYVFTVALVFAVIWFLKLFYKVPF